MRLLRVLLAGPSVGAAVAGELDTSVAVVIVVTLTVVPELTVTLGADESVEVEFRELVADGSAVSESIAEVTADDGFADSEEESSTDVSVPEGADDVKVGVEVPEASAKHAGGMFVGMSNDTPVLVGVATSVDNDELGSIESVAVDSKEDESVVDASSVGVARADASVAVASVSVSVAVEDESVAVTEGKSVFVEVATTDEDESEVVGVSVAMTEDARSVENADASVEEETSVAFAADVVEDTDRVWVEAGTDEELVGEALQVELAV